ncbi:hypothetical protein ACFQ44_01370 [Levilactobacillus lanxiensis]|uniref:Cell surface protein n=1 Tax=Levilactobacillus lanxiensis TaxID=2799568 RepID=A0ABW4CYG8_9LACO|nr:hypothetical protein [Levilactobacillus lanxiensis]
MKLKKILLQLGLLLAFVGVGIGIQSVHVMAMPSLPSGATLLSDSKGVEMNPNGTASIAPGSEVGDMTSSYPSWDTGQNVAANFTSDGRVTNKTTKIYIYFTEGSLKLKNPNYGSYTKVYADVSANVNGKLVSLVTNQQPWTLNSKATVATPPANKWIEMDVDFTHLGVNPQKKIYIGFSDEYTEPYIMPAGAARYATASLVSDDATFAGMAGVTIDGGGSVAASAHEVTGKAQPNIDVFLSGVDGDDGTYHTTADSSGNYTISLGDSTLDSLHAKSPIKVTEYNEYGDVKSATANVVNTVPLTITPATSSLTISPDDWDANIKGKSSSDIATWLAKQSNLVVTKQNSSTALTASGDGLAFDTANDLSTLAGGATQAVQINASDSAGDKSTDPATINVTRGLGNMQFTTISQLVFGNGVNLAVPSTQTLYAPGKYNVDVSDSRATGSPWYLTAQASTLTDGDGGHTFSGHVVYADGNGTVTPLDDGNAVQVASGNRSTSTYDLASDWNQKGDSYTGSSVPAGVYLQANPNVYAGSGTEYTGSMTWTLSDAPKGN